MSEGRTLATSVYARLRQEILSGAAPPGAKLKIDALADRLAAGTAPVREALNRLSAEGLVDRFDQRGFAVARASLSDLHDLVETRIAIESLLLTRAMAARTSAWEEAVVLALHHLSRTPRSLDATSYRTNPDWEARHSAFHTALLAGAQAPRLMRIAADLRDQADRYRQLAAAAIYPRRNDGDEHEAIAAAALDGRSEAAVQLLRHHYRTTLTIIDTHNPDLFEA
jgi:DNA-binding GntR family transcriptional regulator